MYVSGLFGFRFFPGWLRSALCLIVAGLGFATGATGAALQEPVSPAGSDDYIFQLVDQPLVYVLQEYERLSGMPVIIDVGLEGVSMTIDRAEPMSRDEALEFLEKSLLLNGVALIPSGPNFNKAIPFQSSGQPNSEAIPLVASLQDLPEGDAIATYVMRFDYLSATDVVSVLENVMPLHGYGKISPVEGSHSIIVTESASVIRQYDEIRKQIDVPPTDTEQKAYQLERADASIVATAIVEMLGIDGQDGKAASPAVPAVAGGREGRRDRASSPEQLAEQIAVRESGASAGRVNPTPVIHAIPRTNRIVVVARPIDHLYIEQLVKEFDAPAPMRRFFTTKLRFINVVDFLPVARDAILRGMIEEGVDGTGSEGSDRASRDGSAGQGNGQGRVTGAGGDSALSRGASLEEPEMATGPVSELVGKTLLVGDPSANQLSVSGPPEHIEAVKELLAIVDRRPRQVYISAVIGQLTLGDDIEYGVDIMRTLESFEIGGEASKVAGLLRNRGADILDSGELTSIENFLPAAPGLNVYGQIGDHLNVFISALERTQRFKVLSRPSIFALNNRRAVIATGQRIAVPTSTLTNLDGGVGNQGSVTSNIDYRDVVLKLEVVPLINSATEVTLTISQVNDEVIGSTNIGGNEVPTIGTQEMVTSVIVPTGRTVLLGGLVTETMEDTHSGIPILVHIPILKHLFGSTDRKKQRKELVIFLQPHIINDEETLGLGGGDMGQRTEISAESEETLATRFVPMGGSLGVLPGNGVAARPAAENSPPRAEAASTGEKTYFRRMGRQRPLPWRR